MGGTTVSGVAETLCTLPTIDLVQGFSTFASARRHDICERVSRMIVFWAIVVLTWSAIMSWCVPVEGAFEVLPFSGDLFCLKATVFQGFASFGLGVISWDCVIVGIAVGWIGWIW